MFHPERATSASICLLCLRLAFAPCPSLSRQWDTSKGTPLSLPRHHETAEPPSTVDGRSSGPLETLADPGIPPPQTETPACCTLTYDNPRGKGKHTGPSLLAQTHEARNIHRLHNSESFESGTEPTETSKTSSKKTISPSMRRRTDLGIDYTKTGISLDTGRYRKLSQRLILVRPRRSELEASLEQRDDDSTLDGVHGGEGTRSFPLVVAAGSIPENSDSNPLLTTQSDPTTKGTGSNPLLTTHPAWTTESSGTLAASEFTDPQSSSDLGMVTVKNSIQTSTELNNASIPVIYPNISSADFSPGPSSAQPQLTEKPIWLQGRLSFAVYDRALTLSRLVSVVLTAPAFPLAIVSAVTFTHPLLKNRVTSLVIVFNLTEGFKALLFIINRSWKLSLGNALVTWSSPWTSYFIYVVSWMPDSLGRISLVLNTIISVDRFIKLVFPLMSRRWTVVTHPRLIIGLSIFIPTLLNMSCLFLLLTQVPMDNSQTFTQNEVITTIAIAAPEAFKIYGQMHVISSIGFRYLPLLITIILNAIVIGSIIRQQKNFQKYRASSARKEMTRRYQNNATIAVSMLLFSAAVSLKPLIRLVSLGHPTIGEGKRDMFIYSLIQESCLLMDVCSPIITFLTYLRLSSYFRRVLKSRCGKVDEEISDQSQKV